MNKSELLEKEIITSIILENKLINELYIDTKCFSNTFYRRTLEEIKKIYLEHKKVNIGMLLSRVKDKEKQKFMAEFSELISGEATTIPSEFYSYQDMLEENYRNTQIDTLVSKHIKEEITREELINGISKINSENLYLKKKNTKKTPEETIKIARDVERQIKFDRLYNFNTKMFIKENTINVIAARPSEGKSALALNMFCDLSKNYKCLYFNLEMTEPEIYERILGIESGIPIEDIKKPQIEFQDNKILESAKKFYNYNYEIINGSKSINSIKAKIIKEQREEHLIVFIDYIGYVTSKYGMSDKDRIGEITRELNNLTKDYNCTIFIVAQINRSGTDNPTMEDLKDSGELEQSADTIILINDPNKQNNDSTKEIDLLIPKCRGGKRNVFVKVKYYKESQQMEVL